MTLTVKVTDVNDNAPEISIDALTGSSGVAVTSEDAAVDTFVAHVAVSDKDTGSAGRVECFVNISRVCDVSCEMFMSSGTLVCIRNAISY